MSFLSVICFDDGQEVKGVFLDISKKGIIDKIKRNGISSNLLSLSFHKEYKKRVTFNGQCSSQANIDVAVSLRSILGQLLFLICVNDLSDNPQCNPKLFADDAPLLSTVKLLNCPKEQLIKEIDKQDFQQRINLKP